MTPEREAKFRRVATGRQANLAVILENVHDPHNIGAVMRTCDAVGVKEIFILYTESHLTPERVFLSKKSSAGARRWIDVHFFTTPESCFEEVKSRYDKVLSTHLSKDSIPLFQLDLTQSVALLFGNEHAGISKESQKFADGNFTIPMSGMVESLNISVACAVTLYEAYRQRLEKGFFSSNPTMEPREQELLFKEYEKRHLLKTDPKVIEKKNGG
ncbi:MAG: RNA methyltransferase [Bacteroidetes bacterium]|nr:RNA methyltransferase [Bacteroidota bacterium]